MEAQHVFEKLNKLDYSIIDKKVAECDLKGYSVEKVKKETLRFLALCASTKKTLSPPPVIDEYWHQCIMHTKLYFQMAKIFGKYLHHIPSDGSKKQNELNREAFWNTIQTYEDNFGEPDVIGIWGLRKKEVKST